MKACQNCRKPVSMAVTAGCINMHVHEYYYCDACLYPVVIPVCRECGLTYCELLLQMEDGYRQPLSIDKTDVRQCISFNITHVR